MGIFEDFIYGDSGFTLSHALDSAESDFRQDFSKRWGLDSNEPPSDLEKDEWLRARKICGFADQIGATAATLLTRKGLGRDRLALPTLLDQQADEFQKKLDQL